jgi:hypothetical protein
LIYLARLNSLLFNFTVKILSQATILSRMLKKSPVKPAIESLLYSFLKIKFAVRQQKAALQPTLPAAVAVLNG